MRLNKSLSFIPLLLVASLAACGESKESSYDRGYDDGYAVGYNTACKIRTTLISGDWDNPDYSRGYADGNSAGVAACNRR
jgi:uncharacterized lipoprotein